MKILIKVLLSSFILFGSVPTLQANNNNAGMEEIKKKKKKKGKKMKNKEGKGKKGSWGLFKSKWKKKKEN
tara:strand:+ start:246 stop:455 length:210 start_codon:yes stop_codon:yes gene_type:complete